jgi:parvulin-like peptidyl-prolyl isomerase
MQFDLKRGYLEELCNGMLKSARARYLFSIVTAVVCTIFLSGLSCTASGTEEKVLDEEDVLVAKVNGKPIYEKALELYIEKYMGRFKKQMTAQRSARILKLYQKKALKEAVSRELLHQESQKQAMSGIDEYLKKCGILDPEIPGAEITAYYENNKSQFRREEMVRVSHILIKTDKDAGTEEKEAALKKAERIRREIISGADFGETAKKYSEDRAATGGGDLGFIVRGYMPPAFDKEAFGLSKGAVSGPVLTGFGCHILKVTDRRPGGTEPYDEVKGFIINFLKKQVSARKLASHINELKKKADIEVMLD